ncbi:hypothetical protein ACIBG4_03925 [Nonomuraea sp. NPDC050383]|uniref:hypothetical protein n=1 Tax=Nonomuraea sp. NPDC050383 TaxID=3364362 RepID=UPI0037A9484B
MTPRTSATLCGLLVSAVLAVVPLAVRDRLPDPVATHWSGGSAPDGAMPLAASTMMIVALWSVLWVTLVVLAPMAQERRNGRAGWWGALAGGAVLFLGLGGVSLLANLDAASWTEARLSGWRVAAVLGVSLAVGVLAGYLRRGETDPPSAGESAPPSLRLQAGRRAVWVGRAGNRWLAAVTVVAAVALCVVAVLVLLGLAGGVAARALLPGLGITLAVGLFTSSLAARVTEDGLAVGLGPLRWPVRRIRLDAIERAWAETRSPAEVGGWGFRGLPGSATIMLRGGECLVVRYRSGGQLAISVDDAERGASLINALIAERAPV